MENTFDEQRRLQRVRKKLESIIGFYKHLGSYLLINTAILLYTWFTLREEAHFFTLSNFSMPLFWGLGVVFHAIGVFGKNIFLDSAWEERKIQELIEKESRNNVRRWE